MLHKGQKALKEGEKYLIIPSFSPENKPLDYHSAITANAAMDISAARDIVGMYIDMENELKEEGYKTKVAEALELKDRLPDFKFDERCYMRVVYEGIRRIMHTGI